MGASRERRHATSRLAALQNRGEERSQRRGPRRNAKHRDDEGARNALWATEPHARHSQRPQSRSVQFEIETKVHHVGGPPLGRSKENRWPGEDCVRAAVAGAGRRGSSGSPSLTKMSLARFPSTSGTAALVRNLVCLCAAGTLPTVWF